MSRFGNGHTPSPEDDDDLDAEFPLGDGTADSEAEIQCPYCGEILVIALDPGGGSMQRYVEDCQLCCQPLAIHVRYGSDGSAEVGVEAEDERE